MNRKVTDEDLRDFFQILKFADVALVAEAFGISNQTVHKRLKPLVERGTLTRTGRTRYEFVKPVSRATKSIENKEKSATMPVVAGTGKKRRITDKDTEAFLRKIASQIVLVSMGRHPVYRVISTGRLVTASSSSSDRRALVNLRSEFIRAGVKL